jgi:restriction endonuclease S subunit
MSEDYALLTILSKIERLDRKADEILEQFREMHKELEQRLDDINERAGGRY